MNKIARQPGSVFDGLITSNTRIRILMRLFLNPDQRAYLRELSGEFGVSPSLVSGELKHLESSRLIRSERNGRQVFFRANRSHALFPELHSMVRKALGMDRILESIVERLGAVERAFLIDDYAEGKDTGLIDLVLVGDVNLDNLADLCGKTERYIGRKLRVLTLRREERETLDALLRSRPSLEIWRRADRASKLRPEGVITRGEII